VLASGPQWRARKVVLPANSHRPRFRHLDFDSRRGIIIITDGRCMRRRSAPASSTAKPWQCSGCRRHGSRGMCELGRLMGLKGDRMRIADEKACNFAKQHGRRVRLNYATEDSGRLAAGSPAGKGAEIIFDTVAALMPKQRCARSRGRAASS